MQATIDFPETVMEQVEALAREEGATPSELIRRIVQEHVTRHQPSEVYGLRVTLPLIPASETGPIRSITGKDMDQLLSDDDFAA